MEIVGKTFFEQLPVQQVAKRLEDTARDRICAVAGIEASKLPAPLLSKEDIESAVKPLKDAVIVEVQKLEDSFTKRLATEHAQLDEERRKRKRLESCYAERDEEEEALVGTYLCSEGECICGYDTDCEDNRVCMSDFLDFSKEDKQAYVRRYFCVDRIRDEIASLRHTCIDPLTPTEVQYHLRANFPVETFSATREVTDETLLEVLDLVGYDADRICNSAALLCKKGFVTGIKPVFKHKETYLLMPKNYWSPKDVMKSAAEGCKLVHYEELESALYCQPGICCIRLARMYALALLFRCESFTEEDYERMKKGVETCE
jgi:hypothetical protein